MAQKVKRTFWGGVSTGCSLGASLKGLNTKTYVVGVVLLEQPAPALIHILVALVRASHAQRRVHVHVVARQIQRDEALEHNAPSRERLRQEDELTGCCTPVCDHVQHRTELGALFVCAGCVAV